MRAWLLLALLGCQNPLAAEDSPGGTYRLVPSLSEASLLVAEVQDVRSRKSLAQIETGASDAMKWSLGWYDDTTLVLDSHDVGIYLWRKQGDSWKSVSPVPRLACHVAVGLFEAKYGEVIAADRRYCDQQP